MRPSAFTDGNGWCASRRYRRSAACFNEAVGFHRRKPDGGEVRKEFEGTVKLLQ